MNLCLYLVDPLQILLPVRSSGTFVWVGTYSNLISCKTWSVRWQWGNHKVWINLLIEDICKHMEVKHGGIVELCISHSWACINWLSSLRVVCVPEKERCRWWWCRWWPGQPRFEAVCNLSEPIFDTWSSWVDVFASIPSHSRWKWKKFIWVQLF